MQNITFFWFRRDLRLEDNAGLYHALHEGKNVVPVFIFDAEILEALAEPNDQRVPFIHQVISDLKTELQELGSDLVVRHGKPLELWPKLFKEFSAERLYCNHDYEPSAIRRDEKVLKLCEKAGVEFKTFKDHVIFERDEIVTEARKPYTVYTPYKKKWLASLSAFYL
ncbi:MAG: deoxyribodipyrimidine photo-lyase, partial [Proteobacteria bacterium]